MKKRFLSMLVLLAAVATGAKAETVTWTVSDMTDLSIDFHVGSAAHNTIKGITVTASSGGNGAWQGNNISMDEGSTTITFTSSVGNIKSIEITAQSIYSYGDTPSGWTMPGYTKLSWSGDASPTVSMTLSDWTEFSNISEIVFTIGPAAPVTTYSVTLAEGTEDEGNWTISPTEAAEGAKVTASYSGTKKVKSVKAVKKAAAAVITTLDNPITAWTAGSYAVPAGGLTYSDAITVSGDVTLVLTDGETLTLNKGISLAEGATLTIQGNGTMNINGTNNSTASTVAGTGMLVLTSGTLNAKGGNGDGLIITEDWLDIENNIGVSGGVAINGNVTVNGGTVTATGGNGGDLDTSEIVGGYNNHGGNGGAAISGTVTVNAGGWTATNGSNGTYTAGSDDNGCSAGTGGKAVAGTVTDNR